MRRSNTVKLGDLIHDYVKALGMQSKIKEVDLIKQWEKVVGKSAAKATKNLYIKKHKLYVEFNSAVVRNELFLIREEIRKRLNELADQEIIVDIVMR